MYKHHLILILMYMSFICNSFLLTGKASHLAFPDDRLISQVHCSILAEAPAHASGTCSLNVKLLDSSLNGTFVNGQRVGVGNSVRLNDGDIVSLVVVPTEREDGSFGVHGTKGDRVSIFDVLDANGDGRITRQEYNAGFDILDKDRNGFLTRQEFGTSSAAPFNVLDKDGDNRLSRIEWEAGTTALLALLLLYYWRAAEAYVSAL
jgi:hypothetical protein